jgi:5-methylcytosine-specific restriction endonuclease McrA
MNRSIRLDSLGTLSDNKLIRQLESLRGKERKILAGVLRHLIEMERRRLFLPRGYSSLFEFCTQHLKYSRSAAGRRIAAARTLAKFPSLEEYLLNGEINLYSLSLVSGILTEKNLKQVISGIRNRSTREVEALVAGFRPGRILKDRVRTVCVMVPETGSRSGTGSTSFTPATGSSGSSPCTGSSRPTPGAGSEKFPNAAVKGPETDSLEHVRISRKYRLEFAVDPEFMKKFNRMKALLSSNYPEGISFEELFMLLMDEYIDRHSPEGRSARREKRLAEKSRKNNRTPAADRTLAADRTPAADNKEERRTRSIPRKVRDEVFLRDGGRCTFEGTDGRRCNSSWNLQIDHIVPFARGGDNSPGNLRLLCGKHNRLEAERVFGSQHMERFKKKE